VGKIGRMRILVSSLVAAAFLAGCASRPGAPDAQAVRTIASGETFTLALGDSARVGGMPLRFESVSEDSRCPRNTSCFWEGNARVLLVTGDGAGRQEISLNTSSRFDQRAPFANGGLELRALDPSPPTGDARAYVATLHFEART
jgi:hypothetical protein